MKLNIQLFADGEVVIDTKLDTKSFDAQIEQLESKLEDLEDTYRLALKDPDFGEEKLTSLRAEIEKTSNQLFGLYQKQQLLNQKDQFEGMNLGLKDILKKVGKWTIAIFGVRSAYNFVRQSVSTLSQTNKNLARDIENIRYGLASSLAPVIQKIIQWAYTLMQAVNYIWNRLFKRDLFSNMKKSLNSSTKSAQKLQKTIAGFDEMNIVNSSSSGGGGGVDAGKITESLTGVNLLSENLKAVLDDIGDALLILWNNVLKPMWDGILKPIGDWLLDKPERILGFIGAILGFKLIAKIVGVTTALHPLGTAIAVVAGVIASQLIPAIADAIDKQKEYLALMEGGKKTREENTQSFVENSKQVGQNNEQVQNNAKLLLQQIDSSRKVINETRKNVKVTDLLTGNLKTQNAKLRENYDVIYKDIKALGELGKEHLLTDDNAQEFLKSLDTEIWYLAGLRHSCEEGSEEYKKYSEQIEELNGIYREVQLTYADNVKAYWEEIAVLEEKNKTLSKNSKEYQENQRKIENLKQAIEDTKGEYVAELKTKAEKKPVDELKQSIDDVAKNHKGSIDIDTSKGKKSVGSFFKGLGQSVAETLGFNWSSLKKKFGFAKGGIINMPGKGVPLGRAYGGEAGREGVIPLTDSQQMALLGEAIGRYITINASITNTMNGRVISRELQKIQNEDNFAGNR